MNLSKESRAILTPGRKQQKRQSFKVKTNSWFFVLKTSPCFCIRPKSIKFFIFLQFLFDIFIKFERNSKFAQNTIKTHSKSDFDEFDAWTTSDWSNINPHDSIWFLLSSPFINTSPLSIHLTSTLLLHDVLTLFDHHNSHEIVLNHLFLSFSF